MGQHVSVKISPDGEEAVVWFNGDESDLVNISGPAGTVDALCRVLRGSEGAIEHEISQRGAVRAPFESDLTAAETKAAEKAAATAKAEEVAGAKAAAIKAHLDAIESARRELALLAPEALADADAAMPPGDGAEIVALGAADAIAEIKRMTDVTALDRLAETEAASKGRSTVLAAVESRIAELTPS